MIPSATAMITVPRANPEKVYQPAPAASCHRSRERTGICPRNQIHIFEPNARKNTVVKIASASTMNTAATPPALFSTVLATSPECSSSHC